MEKEMDELISYTIKLLEKASEQKKKIEEQRRIIERLKEQIK